MLTKLATAYLLLALTVMIHAAGVSAVLRHLRAALARLEDRFWLVTWMLIRLVGALVVLHLAEIAVWALFYWWQECLPDMESSIYFSGATYTTVGYGDIVLPKEWRLLAPVEGLTGILMCGLSTGIFFAVVNKIYMIHGKADNP